MSLRRLLTCSVSTSCGLCVAGDEQSAPNPCSQTPVQGVHQAGLLCALSSSNFPPASQPGLNTKTWFYNIRGTLLLFPISDHSEMLIMKLIWYPSFVLYLINWRKVKYLQQTHISTWGWMWGWGFWLLHLNVSVSPSCLTSPGQWFC